MTTGSIRIGTCSWAEKGLIESGAFYPPRVVSSEQRLKFYASRFDTVELDSSYYSIPTSRTARAWVERTPERFLFHVKAYGALTGHNINPGELTGELRGLLPPRDRSQESVHVSEPATIKELARALVEALAPLREAGKLGFVIFQFPPWFSHKNANLDYLLHCKDMMAGLPIAVEFRHGSWLARRHAEELFVFLRGHRITYITCDEPQFGSLATAPFHPEATTPVAYLRLHGRNGDAWLQRADPSEGYRYGAQELRQLAAAAKSLSAKTRLTFLMFNNCHGGHAVVNALQMRRILARPP